MIDCKVLEANRLWKRVCVSNQPRPKKALLAIRMRQEYAVIVPIGRNLKSTYVVLAKVSHVILALNEITLAEKMGGSPAPKPSDKDGIPLLNVDTC